MLGRLRESEAWPTIDAIAITHFHLDHWGDLVPWVWGSFYLRANGARAGASRSLGARRAAASYLETLGSRLGFPDMFERAFVVREYEDGDAVRRGRLRGDRRCRLPHYTLETYGVPRRRRRTAWSRTRETAPRATA